MNNPEDQVTGKGQGRGQGKGQGRGQCRGGLITECICPKCNATIPHQQGVPCFESNCPQCGNQMIGKRN